MTEPIKDLFESIREEPLEHYRFRFDAGKTEVIQKKYIQAVLLKFTIVALCCITLIVIGIFVDRAVIGFGAGMLYYLIISYTKTIVTYKKGFKKTAEALDYTVYDYTLYNGFLVVWISSEKSVKQMKFDLKEISRIRVISDFIVMDIQGLIYLMEKDKISENSYFFQVLERKN